MPKGPQFKTFIQPEVQDYIIFGSKVCPACKRKLPACTDWFARDESAPDTLSSHCSECRNEADRGRR